MASRRKLQLMQKVQPLTFKTAAITGLPRWWKQRSFYYEEHRWWNEKNSHLDESQFKPKPQIRHNYSHRYRCPKASTTICHFILNPEGKNASDYILKYFCNHSSEGGWDLRTVWLHIEMLINDKHLAQYTTIARSLNQHLIWCPGLALETMNTLYS